MVEAWQAAVGKGHCRSGFQCYLRLGYLGYVKYCMDFEGMPSELCRIHTSGLSGKGGWLGELGLCSWSWCVLHGGFKVDFY
jgi:hypothetical protein